MNPIQQLIINDTSNHTDVLRSIARERLNDLVEWDNLPERFMRGRKVSKVPSASTDTTGSREGDINYDASYLYICVNNAGTLVWRRIASAAW
jgi:hypothetical protein